MKVAIVAYYFKPDETIGAVRPENWAKWLSVRHDVVVVAPNKKGTVDINVDYEVLRVNSYAVKLLEFLNSYRKSLRNKILESSSVVVGPRKSPSFAFSYRMPCLHDFWFFSCYNALRKIKPEIVIATHSPYINLVVAWIYKIFNHEVALWVDYRDLWTGNHTSSGVPCIRNIERAIESNILRAADIVTTVSNHLCSELQAVSARDAYCVYNSIADYPPSGCFTRKDSKLIRICYVGTIWAGWRDPSDLFSMLNTYIDAHLIEKKDISICLASRNPGNFLMLAEKYGLREMIDFRGGVRRQEALQIQQEADILLLLESNAPEARGVLTGKVFEYLMTDKPILLIGPGPDSELYQLLKKHNRLFTLEDFEKFICGEVQTLPKCIPVDYSEISRDQLLGIMNNLSAQLGRI